VVDSILNSIKKMLGIDIDEVSFDEELIMHTNGALMVMTQLGVGPAEGFSILSEANTWTELLGTRTDLNAVFTDIYLRVRLIFDPPTNGFLVTSIEKQIAEYDWRIEAWHNNPQPEV
jgi:hypothetical protein